MLIDYVNQPPQVTLDFGRVDLAPWRITLWGDEYQAIVDAAAAEVALTPDETLTEALRFRLRADDGGRQAGHGAERRCQAAGGLSAELDLAGAVAKAY